MVIGAACASAWWAKLTLSHQVGVGLACLATTSAVVILIINELDQKS